MKKLHDDLVRVSIFYLRDLVMPGLCNFVIGDILFGIYVSL